MATSLPLDSSRGRRLTALAEVIRQFSQSEHTRRVLNLGVATVGIMVTAPLMLMIAVLVKVTSRGPVIYTQPRVGVDRRGDSEATRQMRRGVDLGGQPFRIFKFRTMQESENGQGEDQVWAKRDDPRVTSIGRILRRYRLDELPQLFNVLRGDMNVVGPRPEQPRLFAEIRNHVLHYQKRQQVLPGITGWAQVSLKYDASIEDVKRKVAFDLEYVARRSAVEDLRIMLKTLPVVILKKGGW